MSFFAGVYTSGGALRDESETRRLLEDAVAADRIKASLYSDHHMLLVHGDLNVFYSPGYLETGTSVAALAGEPLLAQVAAQQEPRSKDLERIAETLLKGDLSLLPKANGTYAACCYSPGSGRLALITDVLGARPLYYYSSGAQVYFSTSLRVLERTKAVPKRTDLTAYAELMSFCYPLGSNTLYRDIKVLRDGQCLMVKQGQVELLTYNSWSETPPAPDSHEEIVDYCHQAFLSALDSRIRPGREHYSLLSGGLDSRCIAAVLQARGEEVTAINCSLPGYQDNEYAIRFAGEAYIPFREVRWSPDAAGTNSGRSTAGLLSHAVRHISPGLVFSGDGGGETLGFLMMAPPVMELLRAGRIQEAIQLYLGAAPLPPRLFDPLIYSEIADAPARGMQRELERFGSLPPEKAMQLFLLTNDLRRHLHEYFECILDHKVELLLPFYDRRVILSVVHIPASLEKFLQHRLYYDWLKRLPSSVTAVPWQVYSSHLPCPVADPNPPANQAAMTRRHIPKVARRWMMEALRIALGSKHPSNVISRKTLLRAVVLHSLGFRDYGYLFKTYLNVSELVSNSTSVLTESTPE